MTTRRGRANNGVEIGSGYDVELRRTNATTAVARWRQVSEPRSVYFSEVGVEESEDLDDVAARYPTPSGTASDGDLDDGEEWQRLNDLFSSRAVIK